MKFIIISIFNTLLLNSFNTQIIKEIQTTTDSFLNKDLNNIIINKPLNNLNSNIIHKGDWNNEEEDDDDENQEEEDNEEEEEEDNDDNENNNGDDNDDEKENEQEINKPIIQSNYPPRPRPIYKPKPKPDHHQHHQQHHHHKPHKPYKPRPPIHSHYPHYPPFRPHHHTHNQCSFYPLLQVPNILPIFNKYYHHSKKMEGWALPPGMKCKKGMYCPYACLPGYYSTQYAINGNDLSLNGNLEEELVLLNIQQQLINNNNQNNNGVVLPLMNPQMINQLNGNPLINGNGLNLPFNNNLNNNKPILANINHPTLISTSTLPINANNPNIKNYPTKDSLQGGLYCNKEGHLIQPRPNEPLCKLGIEGIYFNNELNTHLMLCQSIYPGSMEMLIPNLVKSYDSMPLTIPPFNLKFPAFALFYVNLVSLNKKESCFWQSDNNVQPNGNSAPLLLKLNQLSNLNLIQLKLTFNPNYLSQFNHLNLLDFQILIQCKNRSDKLRALCKRVLCTLNPSSSTKQQCHIVTPRNVPLEIVVRKVELRNSSKLTGNKLFNATMS